jgi:hypothetical protein
MNSANSEDRFLSIGEASRIWRVSPDSLRAWARQGKLHTVPTPGGQHRFRERELIAVLGDPHPSAAGGASREPGRAANDPRHPGRGSAGPFPARLHAGLESGSPEVDLAREELEVTRAQRETAALRREMEGERLQLAKHAEAERAQQQKEQRLEELRAYGRSRAAGLPIEWRQRVISMLQEFVSVRNVPPSLPDHEARTLVDAQVLQIQAQHEAQQRREFNEVLERLQVQPLLRAGENAAALLTLSWDPRDAEEAQAEVARDLARSIGRDWTEADVRRRVERVLEQWVEVDDEDDEDGEEDEADSDGW